MYEKLDWKLTSNLMENSPREPQFIGLQNLAVRVQSAADAAVGRPADRPPTVGFFTVEPPVDRPVDRGLDTDSRSSLPVDRPVDRGQIQRACSLPVDRPVDRDQFQRAKLSGGRPGRSTGPPAYKACAHSCASVDRPVDRQKARSLYLRD